MNNLLKLPVDFHNRDVKNRIVLSNIGSLEDMPKKWSSLKNNLEVILYSGDLGGNGETDTVEINAKLLFESYLNTWVADVDWSSAKRLSNGENIKIEKHHSGLVNINYAPERLDEDILIVHGGDNLPESFWKASTINFHKRGYVIGAPVYCTVILDLDKIKSALPYQNVGYASLGNIRAAGGDVTLMPVSEGFFRLHLIKMSPELASEIFTKKPTKSFLINPRIYVDFNANHGGQVSLTKLGSIKEIAKLGLQLHEGMDLEIYQPDPSDTHPEDELTATAVAHYDTRNREWTAVLSSEIVLTSER